MGGIVSPIALEDSRAPFTVVARVATPSRLAQHVRHQLVVQLRWCRVAIDPFSQNSQPLVLARRQPFTVDLLQHLRVQKESRVGALDVLENVVDARRFSRRGPMDSQLADQRHTQDPNNASHGTPPSLARSSGVTVDSVLILVRATRAPRQQLDR